MHVGLTHWAYLDYQEGWLGLRVEPEDQARADAMKANIPSEERKYLSGKRTWIFKPKWGPTVQALLERHCQGYTILVAPGQGDLVRSLLYGVQPGQDLQAMIPGIGEAEFLGTIGEALPGYESIIIAAIDRATKSGPAQEQMDKAYENALRQWNQSPATRNFVGGMGIEAREYCDRVVGQMRLPRSQFENVDPDLSWNRAINACNGVEP